MEGIINVKINSKIFTLERHIRSLDRAQDISRASILKNAVISAKEVEDWGPIYQDLTKLEVEKNASVNNNSSWQAKYDEKIGGTLETVREKMFNSLVENEIISSILQKSFFLQLLLMNYYSLLKLKQIDCECEGEGEAEDKENITIPEIAACFTELILTDKDSRTLQEIKKLLINWKKTHM